MTAPVTDTGCLLCIDGYMPGGHAQYLGLIYVACPNCRPDCPGCDGDSMFPANYHCLACFLTAMARDDLTVVFCTLCGGVITAEPFTDGSR
jgi:hypothetical protein